MPLIYRCEKRLSGVSSFLSQAGKLELTNAVFTALPTFYICSLELPKAVIKQIDKFRKNCLWQGGELNARKPPKAAWKMVCADKKDGGLGVIDIRKQNEALLLKNLHKFFNRLDIPWVNLVWEKHYKHGKLPSHVKKGSFWWRDNLKLLDKFKEFTFITVGDGPSCLFWSDNWKQITLASSSPELFSFTKNRMISVQAVLNMEIFSDLFHLPISQIAVTQMQSLETDIAQVTLSAEKDKWYYSENSNTFSS